MSVALSREMLVEVEKAVEKEDEKAVEVEKDVAKEVEKDEVVYAVVAVLSAADVAETLDASAA